MNNEPKLCYVTGNWAYFTTQVLSKQWGDDWNDAPYEHNAGEPYKWREGSGEKPYEIVIVAFDGDFVLPDQGHHSSPYSVEMINKKAIPWLRHGYWQRGKDVASIYAGITLDEFIKVVQSCDGNVYLKAEVK